MIVKKSPIQDLHRYHPCPEFLNALPQAFLSITSKESICDTTQTTQHFRKNFKHAARLAKKAALKPRFRMFLFFHLATSKPKFLPLPLAQPEILELSDSTGMSSTARMPS